MTTTLITGGTGGIGQALVSTFARRGDEVIFTCHSDREKCAALEDALCDYSVKGIAFHLGELASHRSLYQSLPESVDILINNAALGSATVARQSADSHDQDRRLFEVNVLGPLWLTQEILGRMRRQGRGKIINISSVGGGIYQYPGFKLADGMSKAAIAHMSKQLAAELVHEPIDVFAVCPGATRTSMFDASTLSRLDAAAQQALIQNLPKGRLIEPQEIADLCLFLGSDLSQVLHGAVIDASMGLGVNPACLADKAT